MSGTSRRITAKNPTGGGHPARIITKECKKMEINATVNEFFKVIDARACVSIFVTDTECIYQGVRAYELLSDSDFLKEYGRDAITGITIALSNVNILVNHKGARR